MFECRTISRREQVDTFESWVREHMSSQYRDAFLSTKYLFRKKFRTFTNHKNFKFIQLRFCNTNAMRNAISIFQKKKWNAVKKYVKTEPKKLVIDGICNRMRIYELYEITIDPMIRCIHTRNMKPVGWVETNYCFPRI